MVVESYESYEWTKCLSTRQSKLSSRQMHLIKETCKFVAGHVGKRPRVMVVESYQWRKLLSTRQSKLTSRQMHLIQGT